MLKSTLDHHLAQNLHLFKLLVLADCLIEIEHGHLVDLLTTALDPVIEIAFHIVDVLVYLNCTARLHCFFLFRQILLVILAHSLVRVRQGEQIILVSDWGIVEVHGVALSENALHLMDRTIFIKHVLNRPHSVLYPTRKKRR